MSSARRASNPDCHNRERVLSPRGVQRSNQLSYGTGKLASATATNTASDSESLQKLISGQLGDGEQEYDLYSALALAPYPLIGP